MCSDPLADALPRAIELVEARCSTGDRFVEDDLRNCLSVALQARGGIVTTEVWLDVRPLWSYKNPQSLRGFDLCLADPEGAPRSCVELKWCDGLVPLRWALWDLLKVVAATRVCSLDGYLVVAAPQSVWQKQVSACGLLDSAEYRLTDLTSGRTDDWNRCLMGNVGARPVSLPEWIDVTQLARPMFSIGSMPWELRLARVDGRGELVPVPAGQELTARG